jgi:hypothetical protein
VGPYVDVDCSNATGVSITVTQDAVLAPFMNSANSSQTASSSSQQPFQGTPTSQSTTLTPGPSNKSWIAGVVIGPIILLALLALGLWVHGQRIKKPQVKLDEDGEYQPVGGRSELEGIGKKKLPELPENRDPQELEAPHEPVELPGETEAKDR